MNRKKQSRKQSRKPSRKSSRKVSRKQSRKQSRKVSRKQSRKQSRKVYREQSRKHSRKQSRKESEISDKIKDVPLSKNKNKGTEASLGEINYHYQNMRNIFNFFYKLKESKKINNVGFFSMKLHNNFFDKSMLEIDILGKNIYPNVGTLKEYKKGLKKIKERFIPITILSKLPDTNENESTIINHANIILIDNKLKQIELFEPHGYKKEISTPLSHVTHYHTKEKLLKKFFNNIYPKYEFINASDIIKSKNFQNLYDYRNGYCVTWSTLYFHYRILNPSFSVEDIVNHIKNKIRLDELLRYASYIENTLKKK